MPTQLNQTQDQTQNQVQPIDKTTGDIYVTEKNLEEILKKLNASLGDEALKEVIEQQKQALEQLNKEFAEQLKEKNDKIAELEKQINDLLLNQPVDPNDPNIGNTLVELKKQLEALRQEAAAEALEQDKIKADLEANANDDMATKKELEAIKEQLNNIENGLSPDFILNDILKDPKKAQEIIQEILKNPHNFPPFNLNPLVDANSDIFAQVRETLNTSRELLRLLSTLDYVNNDFQGDVTQLKEELKQALQDILDKRDEALTQFETIIQALETEVKDIKVIMQTLTKEREYYELLKHETKYYHDESFALYVLCDDYASFCVNIKNDCITLRDDMKALQIDIEAIKEETRSYRDQVEFWHTSLVNMGYDKLVAKINQLEALINTMGEQKKQEMLEAISILGDQYKAELKEILLDYKALLLGDFKEYSNALDSLSREIIELIDDKKLEALDQINITTLSSLDSLQKTKQVILDLINVQTDEAIEELTQHKADYLVELQDTKTDSINSINEAFAGAGAAFMAEIARLNAEILGIKGELIAFGHDFKTEHITQTQTWTTPLGAKRNYLIFLQGGSGYDNSSKNGGITSFGDLKSVNGGLGSSAGRGSSGECSFFTALLEGGVSINITIGEGRTSGFVSISYTLEGISQAQQAEDGTEQEDETQSV
ncbi:hypothetical protein [Helicobacter trogontum]|uniref:Uncharacterized protein n=1 Tax=Helicobacter trogontum TaxID=50960 RepID=A0A4U8SDN9_9HELI|nr:hypothetical protein [Helicobacter trogontum]TLD84245.1 hypothetical protein LS81_001915 [Helicobacter trogontum]